MELVSVPRSGTFLTPKILVSRDAELLLCGPGVGERAKGANDAANSEAVKHSIMLKTVANDPPDGAALRSLAYK
jgi:hypothetical protein